VQGVIEACEIASGPLRVELDALRERFAKSALSQPPATQSSASPSPGPANPVPRGPAEAKADPRIIAIRRSREAQAAAEGRAQRQAQARAAEVAAQVSIRELESTLLTVFDATVAHIDRIRMIYNEQLAKYYRAHERAWRTVVRRSLFRVDTSTANPYATPPTVRDVAWTSNCPWLPSHPAPTPHSEGDTDAES
jgi:hypothetical protein